VFGYAAFIYLDQLINRKDEHAMGDGAADKEMVENSSIAMKFCKNCGTETERNAGVFARFAGKQALRSTTKLRAECNMQKHTSDPIDFMQQRGFLL